MRICGVELKASEAILAVIEITENGFHYINLATKKLPLGDGDSSTQVKSFKETLESFCRDNSIDRICIKKRVKKGEYAGGADTFKMEGVIQVLSVPEVILISPQLIAAVHRKKGIDFPNGLKKYQQGAYLTGVTGKD